MMDWLPIVISLIVAVGGSWWISRSTGAKDISSAAIALVDPLKRRIDDLEGSVETLEEELLETQEELGRTKVELADTQSQLTFVTAELSKAKTERAKDRVRLTRLEKWATALRQQVIDLGGDPISLDEIE